MNRLDRLTSDALQKVKTFTLDDGTPIDLTFRFLPTQSTWMLDVVHEDFTLNGYVIVNGPNILRGFRRLIPFGLMVYSEDGYDPHFPNDFEIERTQIFILSADEVEVVEAGLSG